MPWQKRVRSSSQTDLAKPKRMLEPPRIQAEKEHRLCADPRRKQAAGIAATRLPNVYAPTSTPAADLERCSVDAYPGKQGLDRGEENCLDEDDCAYEKQQTS